MQTVSQTVLRHYRNGRKPDKTLHAYSVTKASYRR
jgi:hypothetical protein